MSGSLPVILIVASLVFSAVVLVYVALDRTPDWTLLAMAGLVELGALVLLVVAVLQVAGGDHDLDGAQLAVLFGYLVVALVALPMGFAWSLAERSRGSTAVLMVVGLTEAFLVVRALQVWQG